MSLMRDERQQPVQHFNMHDDPLTNIETLHLLIWGQGLCIAGYGPDESVLTTKVYVFPKDDMHAVESIFMNEPLVAGPQPVTRIWIADERIMIVPQHLFNEEAAADWLDRFHFVSHNESIQSTTLKQPISIVYPISNDLSALLRKYFPDSKVNALSGVLLQQEISSENDTLELIFLKETIALTLRKKGKLISHQIEACTAIHNLVYKIASVSKDHEITQEHLKVAVSGLCIDENSINELRAFYPKMTVPGTAQFSSFTLLSKLIACAL
jgi:hypothetical protein